MLKNNSLGFSIAGILVVASLISMVALVVMQEFKTQATSSAIVSTKMDEIEIKRQIMLTLVDSFACKKTFSGKFIGQSINNIKNANGISVFTVNGMFGNNKVQMTLLKTRDLNITNGNLRDVDLIIGINKTIMGKTISSELPIHLKVLATNSTDLITDCYSDTSEIISLATIDTCSKLGGTWNLVNLKCDLANYIKKIGDNMTGDLTIASGNIDIQAGDIISLKNVSVGNNKICIGLNCRDFSAKNCVAGKVAIGILGDGNLNCALIPTSTP